MTLQRSVRRIGAAALVASLAVLSSVSPASAHGSGTTTSGDSNIHASDLFNPLGCIQAGTEDGSTTTKITLFSTGTFNDTAGITHRTVFTTDATYYFNPDGTFSDANCTVPYAVPGTLTVGGGGSNATCTSTSATYQRVDNDYTITTTSPTTCQIGTGPTHTANLTYTGTQQACGLDPLANCTNNPATSREFTGTYSQT